MYGGILIDGGPIIHNTFASGISHKHQKIGNNNDEENKLWACGGKVPGTFSPWPARGLPKRLGSIPLGQATTEDAISALSTVA